VIAATAATAATTATTATTYLVAGVRTPIGRYGGALADVRLFGTDSMPETAQRVAEEAGISREDQNAFALRSQERAAAAITSGRMGREIAPVRVAQPQGQVRVVDVDESPRATSMEALARLRPIVPGGSITAGNASGVNDGAAAVLVASTDGDLDLVELNEAFGAQSLAMLRALGLPDDAEHVNPNGGAIVLGHPLGASGARLTLTAAIELADRGARRALATMRIGVGQGMSVLLEAP
jgi:acetyl-CoA acyltransferase